jgi:hypothetical protein
MNTILREHRVAYEIVNGQMQPLNSAALTDLVYEPLAALFNNAKSFHKVESAYREAWKEFAEHRFSNAITDAATALQEMCESLGATQSQLSDQLKHLRNSGLLNSFDAPLVEAISKMISWAGGVRSQIGDTHRVNDTSIEDARFFLAVIGALIIRLAEANPSSNN